MNKSELEEMARTLRRHGYTVEAPKKPEPVNRSYTGSDGQMRNEDGSIIWRNGW